MTRLFDFPYYQQDKYINSDALNTKQDGVWIKRHTRYIAQMQSRALLRMGIKRTIKLPLFLPATERNGILWILVFYKLEPKRKIHIPNN
jgi:hypothetical protein